MFKQPISEQEQAPVYRLGKNSSLSLEGLGQDVVTNKTPLLVPILNDKYRTSSKKRRRPKNDEKGAQDTEPKPPLKMAYDDDDDSVPQVVIHDSSSKKRAKTGDSVMQEMMQRAQTVRISSIKTRVSKKGESKKDRERKEREAKLKAKTEGAACPPVPLPAVAPSSQSTAFATFRPGPSPSLIYKPGIIPNPMANEKKTIPADFVNRVNRQAPDSKDSSTSRGSRGQHAPVAPIAPVEETKTRGPVHDRLKQTVAIRKNHWIGTGIRQVNDVDSKTTRYNRDDLEYDEEPDDGGSYESVVASKSKWVPNGSSSAKSNAKAEIKKESKKPSGNKNKNAKDEQDVDKETEPESKWTPNPKNADPSTFLKRHELIRPDAFKTPREFLPDKAPDIHSYDEDLQCHPIGVDYTSARPSAQWEQGDPSNRVPVLRAHCKLANNHTALINIHGFKPYMLAKVPENVWSPSKDPFKGPMLCDDLKRTLENEMAIIHGRKMTAPFILKVEIVYKNSMRYYSFDQRVPFFKITTVMPNLIASVREVLLGKRSSTAGGIDIWSDRRVFEVFECNILFPMRFMADKGIQGSGWFTMPKGSYEVRSINKSQYAYETEIDTHADSIIGRDANQPEWSAIPSVRILSFDIECAGRQGHFPEPKQDPVIQIACGLTITDSGGTIKLGKDFVKPPPKKKPEDKKDDSKDNGKETKDGKAEVKESKETKETKESKPEQTKFPDKDDKIVNTITKLNMPGEGIKVDLMQGSQGRPAPVLPVGITPTATASSAPPPKPPAPPEAVIQKIIFCMRQTDQVEGSHVYCFEDERDMLLSFREFLIACGPDILTGYNIELFDIPYLLKRAEHLGIPEFPYWTRILKPVTAVKRIFQSKARTQAQMEVDAPGMLIYDMYQIMRRDHKLSSYTLNAVCAVYLDGMTKDDIHYSLITKLYNGTSAQRRRLAQYCIKDAILPIRLLLKLMKYINHVGMARVTGVPIGLLVSRGQGIKSINLLLISGKERDLALPYVSHEVGEDEEDSRAAKCDGATVVEPKRGFYQVPIVTLDFASLYPSIMLAHNLCYSTLLKPGDEKKLPPEDVERVDDNGKITYWVKASKYEGMLPAMLTGFLSARKEARAMCEEAKAAGNSHAAAIYDGKQLALKISANAVYGFTGAQQFPCLEITGTVTYYGRMAIGSSIAKVKETFTKANGYEFDCDVVYGDTDSLMIKFGPNDRRECFRLARIAAKMCTAMFDGKFMDLTVEKVYHPYLLMNKKRYAGVMYMEKTPDKIEKIDKKGIESERRDNSPLLRNTIDAILVEGLVNRNNEAAKMVLTNAILSTLAGQTDMSELITTASWGKAKYKIDPLHVQLAKRMTERDGTGPGVGDRISFVYIKAPKKASMAERTEDPMYVLRNNLPLDFNLYVTEKMQRAVSKLMYYLLTPVDKLVYCDDPKDMEKVMVKEMAYLFKCRHTASKRVARIKLASAESMSLSEDGEPNQAKKSAANLTAFLERRPTCLGCNTALDSAPVLSIMDQFNDNDDDNNDDEQKKSVSMDTDEDGETKPDPWLFTKKKPAKPKSALCHYCEPDRAEIYMRYMAKERALELQNSTLRANCQNCIGDHFQTEDVCSNNECAAYWRREGVFSSLNETREELAQLISW